MENQRKMVCELVSFFGLFLKYFNIYMLVGIKGTSLAKLCYNLNGKQDL